MNDSKSNIVEQTKSTNILISKKGKSTFLLILSIFVVSILAGILGAFKNGEFQKTYDMVMVDTPLDEVDFNDRVFDDLDDNSREVILDKIVVKYDPELGQNYEEEIRVYKGYYKNYFFMSYWFYLETSLNLFLAIIFYVALVNFLIVRREEKDEMYQALSSELNTLIIENDLPPATFEPFLDEWNRERKINQHISNMKFKRSVLEKKTSHKVRKLFYTKDKETGRLIFGPNEKVLNRKFKWYEFLFKEKRIQIKAKKYWYKKERIESFLDKNYIEENVPFEKVKHFRKINPSFVYSGKNVIQKSNDEYSNMMSNTKRYAKDLRKKMALSFIMTSMIASVLSFTLFRADENWLFIVLSVMLKLLPLLVQVILAINYSNVYMENQLIPTIRARVGLASLYMSKKDEIKIDYVKEQPKKIQEEKQESEEPKEKVELNLASGGVI